jgi:hypothetical protein
VSHWSDRGRASARKDGGFSLIEVVVALGILMVLVTATLPQVVAGIRASSTARLVTQAKGMAQAQLDEMRNLPYHVSSDAGRFRDVFDYYYENLTAGANPVCMDGAKFRAPEPRWTGYVVPGGTRCSYEPATGAFYRTVERVEAKKGISAFTIVTSTQFLSGSTPPAPVTPPSGYDTKDAVKGEPASAQIGVTVTVLYTERATLRPTSISTQIARQPPAVTRVRAQASATAVEVGSMTSDTVPVPVSLTAGLLSLNGSLTHSSTVIANVVAASAGLGTGEQAAGASSTVAAPPTGSSAVVTALAGKLGLRCDLACWGGTRVDAPAVSATNGLPLIGSPTSPAQSLLTDKASNSGISFGNGPAGTYRPELKLKAPLVRLDQDKETVAAGSGVSSTCTLGTAGTSSFVTASGYLTTTATGVETCAVARASTVSLFPTEFAPRGVVLIELSRATVRCQVTGGGHVAAVARDYVAVVRYWDGTKYVTAGSITPSSKGDVLEEIPLATTPTGGGKMLGDYIDAWSALTAGEVTALAASGTATVKLPGIISLTTQGVRPSSDPEITTGDPLSVVSLTIGALSCTATDAR